MGVSIPRFFRLSVSSAMFCIHTFSHIRTDANKRLLKKKKKKKIKIKIAHRKGPRQRNN